VPIEPAAMKDRQVIEWDKDDIDALHFMKVDCLALFAAASAREVKTIAEFSEAAIVLRPMTTGREVIEDYSHVGLSLRSHPISFLRQDLRDKHIATCADAMRARDGHCLEVAGLVLVRQMPGSAKGVLFITLEDETGIANLVIWPKLFERQRRIVLASRMMAARGRIQREGDVIHLVVRQLRDFSDMLASIGQRNAAFPLPKSRGDLFHNGGSAPDSPELRTNDLRTRDLYTPDLHIDTLKVKAREFR